MTTPSRISFNGALVLQAVARGHGYGFEIMEFTGLPSGTVYPILRRYEASGFLESSWEDEGAAHEKGRPRRRNYTLTGSGRTALEAATERIRAQQALLGGTAEARGRG